MAGPPTYSEDINTMNATAEAPVLELEQRLAMPLASVPAAQPMTVVPGNAAAQMITAAVQRGASIEELRELMALEREWRADQARQAYFGAFAAFKADAIEIVKTKRVTFKTQKGTTDYKHAELADVVDALTPGLSRHGLSASWKIKSQTRDWIVIECTLRHALGHSESVEMGGPPDDSGGKNPIQAIASAKTYLERYTLKAICGVAEQGEDDDGQGGPEKEPDDPVLLGFTSAALKGEKALRDHYEANVPTEEFWRAKGAYLRKLAKDIDAKGVQP